MRSVGDKKIVSLTSSKTWSEAVFLKEKTKISGETKTSWCFS